MTCDAADAGAAAAFLEQGRRFLADQLLSVLLGASPVAPAPERCEFEPGTP